MFMDAENGGCEFPSCFDCNTSRHNPTTRASITLLCPLHLHYRKLFSHLSGCLFFFGQMWFMHTFFPSSHSIVGSVCEFQMLLTCLFTERLMHLLLGVTRLTKRFHCLFLIINTFKFFYNDCVPSLLDILYSGLFYWEWHCSWIDLKNNDYYCPVYFTHIVI